MIDIDKIFNKHIINGIDIIPIILDITLFCSQKGWKIKPYPKLTIDDTQEYVGDILGNTGAFNVNNDCINVIVAGRHPIDICKTYIHELVHYKQKLEGKFSSEIVSKLSDPRYMENNSELIELEKEAYLLSGFTFREWRDQFK